MNMDPLLLPLFVVNILLVLVDASVGYHLAPVLFQAGGGDPENAESGALVGKPLGDDSRLMAK
jgi:hypothetical protein